MTDYEIRIRCMEAATKLAGKAIQALAASTSIGHNPGEGNIDKDTVVDIAKTLEQYVRGRA